MVAVTSSSTKKCLDTNGKISSRASVIFLLLVSCISSSSGQRRASVKSASRLIARRSAATASRYVRPLWPVASHDHTKLLHRMMRPKNFLPTKNKQHSVTSLSSSQSFNTGCQTQPLTDDIQHQYTSRVNDMHSATKQLSMIFQTLWGKISYQKFINNKRQTIILTTQHNLLVNNL